MIVDFSGGRNRERYVSLAPRAFGAGGRAAGRSDQGIMASSGSDRVSRPPSWGRTRPVTVDSGQKYRFMT